MLYAAFSRLLLLLLLQATLITPRFSLQQRDAMLACHDIDDAQLLLLMLMKLEAAAAAADD